METLLEVQKAHYAPRHGPPMLLHETESNPLQRKSKKRKRRKLLVKNHVFIPNTTTTNNNNNKTTNKSKDATLPPSDLPASDLPEGFPPELAFRALAAYSLIRTLSRELRLSPFSPNVFLRALYLPYPNTLLGQIHCCFLRFLLSNLNMGYHYKNRGNGIPETILKKRRLDGIRWPLKAGDNLTFLDNFSWPLFFDDYVHLTADVLYASLTDEDNHVNFANIGMPDTTDMIMEEDLIEKEEEESLMAPAKFGNRSIIMPVVDSLSRSSRSSRRGGIPYSTMDESDEESHQDDFVEDEEEEEDDVYLTPSRSRKSKKRGRPAKNRPLPCNPPAKQTRKLPTSRSIKSRKIGSVLPTSRNRKSILPLHQKGSQGKRKIPTVDKCEVSRPPTKRVTASPLAGSKVQWVEGPQLELDVLAQNDRSQSAPPKARKPQGAQLTSTQKSISAVFRPSGPPAARTLSNPANGFSRDQVGSTNRQLSDRHGVSNDVANVLHNFIAGKLGKSDKKSEALTAIGDSIISKAVHDAPVVVAAAVSSANETVTAHESDFASGQSVVVASAPRSSSQPPDSAPNIPVDVKDNSHSAFKTETLVDSSLATETVKPRSTVAIGCVTSGGNEPLTDLEEATVVRAKTENAAETDVVMSEAAKTSCEGSSGNAAIVSKSALDPGVLVTGFAAVSAKDKPVGGAPVIDGTLLHTKDSDLTQQLLKRKPDDDPFSTGLQAMSSTADGVMRAGPVKENSARPMRSSSNTEITKVSERYSTGSKHRDRADAARPMLSAENCISSHCTMENSGETAESHVLLVDSSSVDFLKMDLSCSNRQASIELLPSKEVAPSGNSTEGDDTPKKDGSQLIVLAEDKNTDDQTVASEASFDNTVFVDDRASWPQFEPLKSMRSGIPYHRLDLKEKLVMLEFLIDELLTADTFAAEFSRRDLSTYSDAPYGALPSKEELDDLENADECGICKGEGELLCCDGCTSSYHKGCIDMKPYEELPDGRWLCPECELIDPANYGSLWGGRKSSLDWFTVEDVKTAMQQKNHETMLSESTGVDNTAGSTHVGDATLSTTTSLVYNLEAATTGEGLAGKEATTPTSLSYQLHNPIIGPLQITGSKAGSVTQETSASVPVDVTSAQTLDQVALNRSSESSLQKVQNSSGVAALLQPSLILDSAATTEASTAPGISAILNNLGSSAARVVPAIATSNSDLCKVAPQENPTKDAAMNDDTSTPKPHGKIPDHELLAIHGFVFAREPQSKRGTKCPLAKEDLRKMLIAIGPEMSVSWPLAQIPFSSFEAARTPNHPNPLSLEARAMFDPSSYTNKYRSVPLPKGVFPGIGFQNISLVLSSYEKECCRPDTKYLSNKLSPCMMIDGNLVKSLKAERNLFDPYQMIRDYLLKVEGFLNRAHLLHECWGTLNKEFKTDVWQTNVRKCCSVPRLARLVLKLVDATHERAFLEDWHLVVGGKDLEKLHHESGTDKVAFYPLCDDWTSGAEIKKYQWQNCSLSDIRGLLQSSGQDVSSWVYGQRNAVRATMSKRKRKQTLAERQRPSDAKKMVPQKQANMHLESFNREDMGRTSEVSFSKVAGATLSSVQQLQKAIEVRVGAGIADVSNENSSTVCGFRLSVPGSKEMNGGSSGQGRSDQGTRSDIPEVAETVITASDAGISEVQSDVIRLKQSGQWPQISASITIPEVAGLAVAPSTGTVESLVNGNKKEPTNTPQLGVAGTADAQGDEGKTNPSVPGNTATSNMPSVQTPPKKAESGVSSDVPTDISIETSPAENNAEDESKHKKRKRRKESTSATKSARSRRSGRLQTRQETPEDFIASVIADTGKAHKDLSMETIIEAQKMAKLVEIKELCSMPVLSAQTWPVAGRMLFEPVGSLSSAEMKRLGKRAGKVGAQNVRYAGNFEVGVVSQFHVSFFCELYFLSSSLKRQPYSYHFINCGTRRYGGRSFESVRALKSWYCLFVLWNLSWTNPQSLNARLWLDAPHLCEHNSPKKFAVLEKTHQLV